MGITRFDQVEVGTSAVTGAALAATSKTQNTILTTESLSTAAATSITYTFNNKLIKSGATPIGTSAVLAQIIGGTNTTGIPTVLQSKVTGAGVATITIRNIDAAVALNGTLILSVMVSNSTEK